MNWNHVVLLGIAVNAATLWLVRGSRAASVPSLERRCRWAIRLTLGYAAVLLLAVLVPFGQFAWAHWLDDAASVERRALLLGVSIGSAFNLVLGVLIFGLVPTGVAFMFARRAERKGEPRAESRVEG